MPNLDHQTIQLALVAAVAAAFVLQAIVLFAALLVLRNLAKTVRLEIQDLRDAAMPVIESTRELVEHVKPRIEEKTEDLAQVARALNVQVADVQSAASEILVRARQQADRIDTMFSSVLDSVDRIGGMMADTVTKPMRQLSAFLASARAVVESLRNPESTPRPGASRPTGRSDPYA